MVVRRVLDRLGEAQRLRVGEQTADEGDARRRPVLRPIPLGITTCGCPVRFVSSSIDPPKLGVTTTSIPSMTCAKRCMAIVRSRFAWMYSDAGIIRPVRMMLGRAFSPCWTSSSSRPLRISGSNAAPCSALRMIRIAS